MKDFSRSTQAYILGIIGLAGFLAIWQFTQNSVAGSWLLLATCVIASLLQSTAVFGATARSTYSLSWIIYAFVLVVLGIPATLLVVFISHLAEWLLDRDRLAWYIQSFNVSNFFIATTLSGLIIKWGQTTFGSNSGFSFSTILLALAAFTFLNHLFVAIVIRLARGQTFSESGVFGWFTILLDFTLLCLGFTGAIIWQVNAIALTLVLFLSFMLYEALKIPALERKTEIDQKTQLYNARYFIEAFEDELTRSERFKRPLSLIMADLDFLRNINNSYGHLAGDVVLQGIAEILQEMTREYDIAARFGGEEFSILLPETKLENAVIVAERIRERIESTQFEIATSVNPIRATMSFGITGREESKQNVNELIHQADLALYRAKESGRNRVCIYDKQIDVEAGSVQREWAKLEVITKLNSVSPPAHEKNNNHHEDNQRLADATNYPSRKRSPKRPSPPETASAPAEIASPQSGIKRNYPKWSLNVYIAGLVIFTAAFAYYLINQGRYNINWLQIIVFATIIFVMEIASIEIYVRDTSVSTTAALLVSGVLLFGTPAAIVLGSVIAFVSFAKRSSKIIQLLFNSSNHILGGLIVAFILSFNNMPVETWSLLRLLIFGAGMAGMLYLSTTFLLTIVIGLGSGYSFKAIWIERFRWLIPYYLALGLVAAMLVFSYLAINMTGILITLLPLLLLRYSQKQYIDHTENLVQNLQATNTKLEQQAKEITHLNEELLLTLARSVDLRDPYVMEHSKHVSRYAVLIAEEIGLLSRQVETVRKAGLLHDIGKLGIPESILFKPDRLTVNEYELVKKHVTIGAELIQTCHALESLVPFVLHHHEWFNGQGYPDGLAGDEIPIEARILGLADAVETMASDRPYKKALLPATIHEEITRFAGTQFDPIIVQAFARIIERSRGEVIVNSSRLVLARQKNGVKTNETHPFLGKIDKAFEN